MKLSFDAEHNVAYLRLREKSGELETLRISDELFLDMSPDGTVYGIEFLNAKDQILSMDNGRLVLADGAGGLIESMPLPTAAE